MFLVPSTLKTEEERLQDLEKCSRKGKKGSIRVRVGLEEGSNNKEGFQTFVIPISDLYHPLFKDLLEKAQEMYGCPSGLLTLPCSVQEFQNLRNRVERETSVPQFPHQPQPRYI